MLPLQLTRTALLSFIPEDLKFSIGTKNIMSLARNFPTNS